MLNTKVKGMILKSFPTIDQEINDSDLMGLICCNPMVKEKYDQFLSAAKEASTMHEQVMEIIEDCPIIRLMYDESVILCEELDDLLHGLNSYTNKRAFDCIDCHSPNLYVVAKNYTLTKAISRYVDMKSYSHNRRVADVKINQYADVIDEIFNQWDSEE